MITTEQLHSWKDRTVLDDAGEKIGTVHSTYEDSKTGKPDWLTVGSGLLGRNVNFVPAIGASEQGDDVQVGWSKDVIRDSPGVDDSGGITPEQETSLRKHYGVSVDDFAYDDVDDGRGRVAEQSEEQVGQDARDSRDDARRESRDLKRPEDFAVEHDGSPVRDQN